MKASLFTYVRLLSALCLVSVLGACDIIESPYFDPEYIAQLPADEQCLFEANKTVAFPEGQPIVKKVLVEEMTGHKCGNCPEATEVAYQLYSETFQDQAVFLGIHAGPLARFTAAASKYFTNFTTSEGDEVYTTLNPGGVVPFVMIDRSIKNSSSGSWPTAMAERVKEAPVAGIRVFNCYTLDSLSAGTVIDVKFLEDASAAAHIAVWLVEDDVIDWQKDYRAPGGKVDLEDYSHHQVLRKAINGAWGEPINADGVSAGDTYQFNYTVELEEGFDPAHCKVIAFIYDRDTEEVGQVEQQSLL
ncbi:MAG: Omp28 family outer membrane lipoprotein [Bacteroidota bacterium]